MNGVAIVSVLAACIASGVASVGEQHPGYLREHYEHLAYIATLPCHKPQPRVVSVHKLFADTGVKAYFPDVTLLHRCDDEAGCCTDGNSCLPVRAYSVDLPFKVKFLEKHGEHKKGTWNMEYYTVHNHTECACGHKPGNPSYQGVHPARYSTPPYN